MCLLHNHKAVREAYQSCDCSKGSYTLQRRTFMLTRINLVFWLLTVSQQHEVETRPSRKRLFNWLSFLWFYNLKLLRFGHGSAKLARQAQSKEKTLAKMVAGGLTEKVGNDYAISFHFYSCGEIPPPVLAVQVSYYFTFLFKIRFDFKSTYSSV